MKLLTFSSAFLYKLVKLASLFYVGYTDLLNDTFINWRLFSFTHILYISIIPTQDQDQYQNADYSFLSGRVGEKKKVFTICITGVYELSHPYSQKIVL